MQQCSLVSDNNNRRMNWRRILLWPFALVTGVEAIQKLHARLMTLYSCTDTHVAMSLSQPTLQGAMPGAGNDLHMVVVAAQARLSRHIVQVHGWNAGTLGTQWGPARGVMKLR